MLWAAGLEIIFRNLLKFGTEVSIVDSEQNRIMKIEANNLSLPASNLRPTRRALAPATDFDLADVTTSRRLQAALRDVPDVRADAVARGRALVADPNYPSQEQIKAMAKVLAARLA